MFTNTMNITVGQLKSFLDGKGIQWGDGCSVTGEGNPLLPDDKIYLQIGNMHTGNFHLDVRKSKAGERSLHFVVNENNLEQ